MEHSDYTKLLSLFESVNTGIELLHWVQNDGKQCMADPNSKGMMMWPGIRPGGWFIFARDNSHDPDKLNGLLSGWYYAIWGFMGEHEDGYYRTNQQRADQQLGPTTDMVSLVRAMNRFLSGYEGENSLGDIVREISKRWVDQATGWFPDLNDQVDNQEPADLVVTSTTATITIDRDMLAGLFIAKFKEPRPRPGMEPLPPGFEMFYNAFVTGAVNYTPTDIGRIAHQVKQSKWVVARVRRMPFSKWLREFCGVCGSTVPKDTAPTRYKTPTPATDFSAWLE